MAGSKRGEDDPRDGAPAAGAERGGDFLRLAVDLFQHGLHGADDERQADEDQRHDDADGGEADLEAEPVVEDRAERAVGRVERRQRDARDGGGERERQVDGGVEPAAAGEAVAHQHPGHEHAEEGVDDGGDQRRAEGKLQRCDDARVEGDAPELVPAQRGRADAEAGERDQDDERQVRDRISQAQAEAWQDTTPPPAENCAPRPAPLPSYTISQ